MTLGALMRGGSKAADGTDARGALRLAQARVKQARDVAQGAAQAVARAEAVVTRARDVLAACGDVDADVACHRAAEVRGGGTGARPLPNALATRRQRQQVAQLELADAERAARLLGNDETTTKTALAEAEAELRLVLDRVMQAEALRVVGRLRERERACAADRMLIGGLLAIRTMSDPPVAWEVQACMLEPAQQPALDLATTMRIPPADPVWRGLQGRLLIDPEATLADGG